MTVHNLRGDFAREVFSGDNPLDDYSSGEMKLLSFNSPAGDSLFGRLYYPPNYQPDRLYPMVVYVYGGPHSQLVRNTWLGGQGSWPLWLLYLASKDYLVFTVDNRGTYYRGKAFEQATFRQLGSVEIEDQLAAIKQVREVASVDTSRIAVVGWSYGGFMATSLMLRAPGVFKVGIAGAPVIDWKYYETIYTERYMATPEANPEGYQTANTREYVANLQGKFLMIQGTSDDIVMWQQSIEFLRAAINANVQLDYFVYPGHRHGIRGKDRLHLFTKMSRFIFDNL